MQPGLSHGLLSPSTMMKTVRLGRSTAVVLAAVLGLVPEQAPSRVRAQDASAAQTRRPGTAEPRDWIQLFNGRDLTDWTIKFAKHDLGENFNNTFRVEDGLLKVRYDQWPTFNGEFGHIFYKDPFSYYLLAAEYRFVGEQVRRCAGAGRSATTA